MFGSHREHIQQRAAYRELAGRTDLCDRGVTRLDEPHTERFQRQGVTDRQVETARGNPPAGCESLQQRVEGDEDQPPTQSRQFGEGTQSFGDDIRQRREQVPGQHFPVGQRQHRQTFTHEETKFRAPSFQTAAVRFDDQPRTIVLASGLGQCERGGAAVQARPAHERASGVGEQGLEEGGAGCGHGRASLQRRSGRARGVDAVRVAEPMWFNPPRHVPAAAAVRGLALCAGPEPQVLRLLHHLGVARRGLRGRGSPDRDPVGDERFRGDIPGAPARIVRPCPCDRGAGR